MFPSFLITNSYIPINKESLSQTVEIGNIRVYSNSQFNKRGKIFVNEKRWMYINTNKGFESILIADFKGFEKYNLNESAYQNAKKFRQGFFISIDNLTGNFELLNDCFGIYPIFYIKRVNEFFIS